MRIFIQFKAFVLVKPYSVTKYRFDCVVRCGKGCYNISRYDRHRKVKMKQKNMNVEIECLSSSIKQ